MELPDVVFVFGLIQFYIIILSIYLVVQAFTSPTSVELQTGDKFL